MYEYEYKYDFSGSAEKFVQELVPSPRTLWFTSPPF
jgi:hypothetical protein